MTPMIDNQSLYTAATSLAIYSEQSRWSRLNSYLVVNSILLVAWATVFASQSGNNRSCVLAVLCLPGIILGIIWAFLGERSSQYLDILHSSIEKFEKSIPVEMSLRPFLVVAGPREKIREGGKFNKLTSSRAIVIGVPLVFSLLYVFLGIISLVT